MKLSIVIPCYNEEKTIAEVVGKVKSAPLPAGWDKEIIVIDDGSTDKTKEVLKKIAAGENSSAFKLFLKEKNRGKGAALKEGFKKATGDYIVIQDADLEYDPNDYQKLLEPIVAKKAEIVIGSRVKSGARFKDNPLFFGSLILTRIFNVLFWSHLSDISTCYKVFPKKIAAALWSYPANDFSYDAVELTYGLVKSGLPMEDVFINYLPRNKSGGKKLKPKDGLRVLGKMLWLRFFGADNRKSTLSFLGLVLILAAYIYLIVQNIKAPFIHVSEDNNGIYGLSALNWVKFNPLAMKFGMYVDWLNNLKDAFGHFYTDHPSLFLLPTYFIYLIFGASDVTTKIGPILVTALGLVLFFFAVRKISQSVLVAFLVGLIFAILPGTAYYGKVLELTVFVAPLSLITFSLFIFYYFEKNRRWQKFYFYAFWASVIYGCLSVWFYYFMPAAIWLFILLTKEGKATPKRKTLLVALPIAAISLFLAVIGQLYALNGVSALVGLQSQFFNRSAGLPLGGWLSRIIWISELNFNILFLIGAALGLVLLLAKIKNDNHIFYLPVIIAPLFVILVFREWSTHPFGVIDFLPAVALLNGFLLASLIKEFNLKILGYIIIIAALGAGFYFSLQKLDFFYNQFLILGPNDIPLIQQLKPQIGNDELCLGQSESGVALNSNIEWYIKEHILSSPSCFSQNPKFGVVFRPTSQSDSFALDELQRFENNGFNKLVGCGDFWCVISK
ncbi:MAG: glycosyltransferase [Patescibacteria group bacterium]|nr:glycosyltransferase [Patescibacteria group bacterium]